MPIKIYNCDDDLKHMQAACALSKNVLDFIEQHVQAGISTEELNDLCHKFIVDNGAISATLNYKGFPKSVCTSVNNVVCHGIPGAYRLKNGDIINIDVTVILNGWFGDTSRTFIVGEATNLAKKLVETAQKALEIGIQAVKPGGFFGDIGKAIQTYVQSLGFSVVRDYCGHGIGTSFHEEPMVLHYNSDKNGEMILPGMFFTIEPMINAGLHKTRVLSDKWTAVTVDKSLSAQFEHTIGVTENDVLTLTK
ncbi:MAG: type I methionyl aminopeptidase [Holosporales bacterium]|jgi:methionyl aminopeptidase|nr:type I methionyl aminopeptidase [Holosporales bacterium]